MTLVRLEPTTPQSRLSYDRGHFSNTDLSGLRIVSTWGILILSNASVNHVNRPIS